MSLLSSSAPWGGQLLLIGIDIPAMAADVIREERLDDFIHLTVESGP